MVNSNVFYEKMQSFSRPPSRKMWKRLNYRSTYEKFMLPCERSFPLILLSTWSNQTQYFLQRNALFLQARSPRVGWVRGLRASEVVLVSAQTVGQYEFCVLIWEPEEFWICARFLPRCVNVFWVWWRVERRRLRSDHTKHIYTEV